LGSSCRKKKAETSSNSWNMQLAINTAKKKRKGKRIRRHDANAYRFAKNMNNKDTTNLERGF
jgi:hypothetical protein